MCDKGFEHGRNFTELEHWKAVNWQNQIKPRCTRPTSSAKALRKQPSRISMAPASQHELAQLEKVNAPFQDQLDQAAIFAGFDPLRSEKDVERKSQKPNGIKSRYHGRQEYVFRWLLKKWSAEGEEGCQARICPKSWRIFTRCLEIIPTRTSARILHERKFYQVLRRTVEEGLENTRKWKTCINAAEEEKTSKKRKRHGTPSEIEIMASQSTFHLRQEILDAILHIVSMFEPGPAEPDAFEGDYMRSVIRMTTAEAGQIFGGWLKWNLTSLPSPKNIQQDWLAPFAEIWRLHVVETQDSQAFSKYCLKPVLDLLSSGNIIELFKSNLEQLMARNIIIPARAAYDKSSNGDILKALIGDIVFTNPNFASIIFDVSVRCIQIHGTRHYRPNEIAWLQKVFETCKDSIIGTSEENTSISSVSLSILLKGAMNSHVKLDLSLLKIIVSESAFGAAETDWSIVATAIAMDSNVFLIPDSGTDLLKDLLKRVTNATVNDPHRLQQNQLCSTIILPLMGEFAKARNLIGFVHHWYDQLMQFENLRPKDTVLPLGIPDTGVWEDDRLQEKLKELMESALTTQQISELVAWLESKMNDCSSAVYVISDAIASATTRDETIDVVKEYLRSSVLKTEFYQGLDTRYSTRPFRIATKSLRWVMDDYRSDWSTSYREELVQLLAVEVQLKDSTQRAIICPEKFRCAYAASSFSSLETEDPFLVNLVRLQSDCLTSFIETLKVDKRDVQSVEDDNKRIGKYNSMQYVCREFARCLCVEYPEALEALLNKPMLDGNKIMERIIWLASATTPFSNNSSPMPWIRDNCDVYSSIVRNMISSECVLNNSRTIGPIIDALLKCRDHIDNPIETARACNGFVITCLLQLPNEVFSKSQREAILRAWPPASPDSALNDVEATVYRVTSLDPAVLSLKTKMMRQPTLYKGIKFQELVDLAECIKGLSSEPKVLLPIFSELVDLTISHALATSDQPKSAEYIGDMSRILEEWLQESNESKSSPSYAMIQLTGTVLDTVVGKFSHPDRRKSLPKTTLDKLLSNFTTLLLSTVKRQLQKVEKLKNDECHRTMVVYCALNALSNLSVSDPSLNTLRTAIKPSLPMLRELNPLLCKRVETFLIELAPKSFDVESFLAIPMVDDIMTIDGRQSIQKKIVSITKSISKTETLQWINTILEKALLEPGSLGLMLALRHTIAASQDSRDVIIIPNQEADVFSLSSAYSTLAVHLLKCKTVHQFCLIAEIMEMILRNKSHSVSQYNVDISFSSITSMCTRIAPSLPSRRAGTIYLHLTRLLHALLTSHRLKLQGRYHILVLTLTSLLRCLFVFLATRSNYSHLPPPWLPRNSEPLKSQLDVIHAAAFTRLITLICSPTLSTVSRSSGIATASLHNPTSKAKHQAAQHMPVLLSSYIHMQLDMSLRMKPEVREALVPAVYAIFDTMGKEERRALGESMDAAGRAVLGTMVRDWARWGKWKGN